MLTEIYKCQLNFFQINVVSRVSDHTFIRKCSYKLMTDIFKSAQVSASIYMCSTSVDGSGRYVSARFTVKLQEARSRCDCKAFCKIFFRWLVTYKYVTPCNQGYCQTAFIHMVPNHTSFYSLNILDW